MNTRILCAALCAAILGLPSTVVLGQANMPNRECSRQLPPDQWDACIGFWSDARSQTTYWGAFRDGVPHGYGHMQMGRSSYFGEFLQGRMHGHGDMRFEDGRRYIGEIRQGVLEGRGRLFSEQGQEVFSGVFVNGVPAGPDTLAATANPGGPAAGVAPAAPVQAAPPQAAAAPPRPAAAGPRQERGFATGRISMPDGSPLPASVERVRIWINGVSSAGQNVSYEPDIRPDGTYRQPLAPGAYRFSIGSVMVRHKERTFDMPLEPVGTLHTTSRDAADGMVQNFVWKATGPRPNALAVGPDTGNHTHWYGMRIGTQPGGWRVDYTDQGSLVNMGRAPRGIPEGTRITLRLRPLTPAFDGRPLSETLLERDIGRMRADGGPSYGQITTTFHDLPPADYELTGFATLPNGNRHTLLFRGTEANRLGFVREARVNVEWDQWLQTLAQRTLAFYLEGNP